MAKRKRKSTRAKPQSGSWPIDLVAMAAAGRGDGGVGLQQLLQDAGFAEKPAMSIVVKRPARPRTERVDPYVDDVLDALRALCA